MLKIRNMRVVMIGAGRLATQLAPALIKAGHEITCVYSRTMASAEVLARKTASKAVCNCKDLPDDADIYIIAVKDSVLVDLIPQLTKGREGKVFVHTAGSMPMTVFDGTARRYGVLYPMQSFSKDRAVEFSEIPVFIEGNSEDALNVISELAHSVSNNVKVLSSADRQYLHLAAVFACNFVNHCYAMSAQLLEEHGMTFDVMLPLIDETARKVHDLHPLKAQTGPAVRYDKNVIAHQQQLLQQHQQMQTLYELMSRHIHEKAAENA